jgi:hypothetical protein
MLIEHRRHRHDLLEEVADRHHVLVLVENAAVQRRLVAVVGHRIPGTEHQVIEAGERHEVLDQWSAALRALAEPDGHQLGERTGGRGHPATHQLDAGDEGRCHCAQADTQHAELTVRRLDLPRR